MFSSEHGGLIQLYCQKTPVSVLASFYQCQLGCWWRLQGFCMPFSRGGGENRFFDFSRFSLERFCLDSEKFIIDFLIKKKKLIFFFFFFIYLSFFVFSVICVERILSLFKKFIIYFFIKKKKFKFFFFFFTHSFCVEMQAAS